MKFGIAVLILLVTLPSLASAFLISDQGTNVLEVATGSLTASANLTISIYDNLTGGNLIFEQSFEDGIANGSWNVMINPNLKYGLSYYKDYQINGEDLDFDGNERLEFQSSVGGINNVSFINFSLINSCSAGSSIRFIYENGSVECETDDDSGSLNLTNYALKNQSETFEGNITTSQTGFFGWLGSLTSRITKIFVQDIDFNGTINGSGNINITGNVSAGYFMGDGSLLTNLPAGTESDPIFAAENSTLWAAINSKLAETDQRYNETTLVLSVNTTSNIMNLDFYNKSEVDDLVAGAGGGNSSFNQSLTDTLYYSISNPSNFINETTGQVFNDTTLILTVNSSLWNYINSNEASWLSTYNETYDAKAGTGNCPAGQVVVNTTSSGVQCAIPTAVETEPAWNGNYSIFTGLINNGSYLSTYNFTYNAWAYNQTTPAEAYTDSVVSANNASWLSTYNATYAGSVNNASYLSTYNATYDAKVSGNSSWNQSLAGSLYAGVQWNYNQTTPFTDWLSTFAYNYNQTTPAITYADNINTSLSSRIDGISEENSSWNQSLANSLYAGVQWNYNQTTPAQTYTDSVVSANNASWLSTYNATYAGSVNNASYLST
ncbi:MAG: hypothetical protein KJ858_01015, partial [Nanoarchaeota archaeon]|nr:hypothetical protein [Nanoarchaeota archaeon]